ncbi:MAG: hypothetical protein A2Y17_07235 [Clostridiales bacterium GWF2_38_85]|nr:MAG: hypothetical protein A2Y17_07235 [Clostridiales bacterium GWF2_38_85]
MKLACNYYPEVIELIQEGLINIDYLKYPALGYQMNVFNSDDLSEYEKFTHNINKIRPIMLHGLGTTTLNLCSKNFQAQINVERTRELLNMNGVNGISVHLSGIDESLSFEVNKRISIENLKYIKNTFPGKEFYSIENVDTLRFGICVYPEFISQVVRESGADFLLDISHAYCAAKALGMCFYSYMEKLPLEKVYEIHINGWIDAGDKMMCHIKITNEAYTTLKWVLERCSPEIVTLEYGRDNDRINSGIPLMSPDKINPKAKEEIVEQLNRLNEILGR